ncbi:hypothetical protein ACQ4PT_048782 [Festuca glaucescens]
MRKVEMRTVALIVALTAAACSTPLGEAAVFSKDPLDPRESWYRPYDRIVCDFSKAATGPGYRRCTQDVIAKAIQGSRNQAYGRPVLARQTLPEAPPSRWIMVEVLGSAARDAAMLAVRADNLYLIGFASQSGRWYVFSNRANLIPSATVLPSSDNYTALVGYGGYRNLEKLLVGRTSTLHAVSRLASFDADYSPDADDGCMRRAVAILAVTLCEAARFPQIQQRIADNWVHGVSLQAQNLLVVEWSTISCGLLISVQHRGQWGGKEAQMLLTKLHMHTRAAAEAAVNVLLWPSATACSERVTWLRT